MRRDVQASLEAQSTKEVNALVIGRHREAGILATKEGKNTAATSLELPPTQSPKKG